MRESQRCPVRRLTRSQSSATILTTSATVSRAAAPTVEAAVLASRPTPTAPVPVTRVPADPAVPAPTAAPNRTNRPSCRPSEERNASDAEKLNGSPTNAVWPNNQILSLLLSFIYSIRAKVNMVCFNIREYVLLIRFIIWIIYHFYFEGDISKYCTKKMSLILLGILLELLLVLSLIGIICLISIFLVGILCMYCVEILASLFLPLVETYEK